MSVAKSKKIANDVEPPAEGGSTDLRGLVSLVKSLIPTSDEPNVFYFFLEHGRLPYLNDEIPAYEYRGWLLPYIMDLHAHPFFGKSGEQARARGKEIVKVPPELLKRGIGDCPDRWGYYLSILDAGKLPDEPIPYLEFTGSPGPAGMKQVQKAVEIFERKGEGHNSLGSFISWLGWALGTEKEKPKISAEINEQLYRSFNAEPLLLAPHDYLGVFLEEWRGRAKRWSGFFLTPHHLCELLIRLSIGEGDHRLETVCEPAVGTGRMLLHASNHLLRLYGQDVDGTCIAVCKINGALYAPWLTWPIPERCFPSDIQRVPPAPAPLPVEVSGQETQYRVSEKRARKPRRIDDNGQGTLF
jgi:hypothetical protein